MLKLHARLIGIKRFVGLVICLWNQGSAMLLLESRNLDRNSNRKHVHPSGWRAASDVLDRVGLLCPRDQLLVELSLKNLLSRQQVGRIMGITPGAVTRKLRRLVNQLNDPLIKALTDSSCSLAPDRKRLGIDHFLHRVPVAQLMVTHRLSRYEVIQSLIFIRGWHRGLSQRK